MEPLKIYLAWKALNSISRSDTKTKNLNIKSNNLKILYFIYSVRMPTVGSEMREREQIKTKTTNKMHL